MKIRLFIIVFTVLGLTVCSPKLSGYPSLSNQGILPLSPSNSYLGTNLFLGTEAAKSRILYQFLKGRGAPGAIEIVEKDFKAAQLFLYYPRQLQVYLAELVSKKHSYEWIIRGPYSIDREDFRKLINIERVNYEASPIIIDGKIERFTPEIITPPPPPEKPKPVKTAVPTKKPSKKVSKSATPVVKKGPASETVQSPSPTPTPATPSEVIISGVPLNSDQQAIRLSRGLTELSPEGDPIHRVKDASETLDAIAKWYSGDEAQAKTIAEFNSLPAGAALPQGAKIKIPKALAKTDQAMK